MMIRPYTTLGVFLALLGVGNQLAAAYSAGDIAADFTLQNRLEGGNLHLADYTGQIVVLDFFAYWCGPCQASSPDLEENVAKYYLDRGGNDHGIPVSVIAVNIESRNEAATDLFIENAGLELVANDYNRVAWGQYSMGYIPHFVVINGVENSPSHQQWEILYTGYSYQGASFYRDLIDAVEAPELSGGHRHIVWQLFWNLVRRDPTEQELEQYLTALLDGSLTTASFMEELVFSEDVQDHLAGLIRLYFAYFGRYPDREGLLYWLSVLDAGRSLESISDQFADSQEFLQKYGILSDRDFAGLIYDDVLMRPADPAGLDYWSGQLQSGMTRGELMLRFSESEEYRGKVAEKIPMSVAFLILGDGLPEPAEVSTWESGIRDSGLVSDLFDMVVEDEAFQKFTIQALPNPGSLVDLAFTRILDRAPTSEELELWVSGLQADETSVVELLRALLYGAEFQDQTGAVARLYWAVFLRNPDIAGLEHWTTVFGQGRSLASIAESFVESGEFQQKYGSLEDRAFVNLVYQNVLGRPADPGGVDHWSAQLQNGLSRGELMVRYAESEEFSTRRWAELMIAYAYGAFGDAMPSGAELGYLLDVLYNNPDLSGKLLFDSLGRSLPGL